MAMFIQYTRYSAIDYLAPPINYLPATATASATTAIHLQNGWRIQRISRGMRSHNLRFTLVSSAHPHRNFLTGAVCGERDIACLEIVSDEMVNVQKYNICAIEYYYYNILVLSHSLQFVFSIITATRRSSISGSATATWDGEQHKS